MINTKIQSAHQEKLDEEAQSSQEEESAGCRVRGQSMAGVQRESLKEVGSNKAMSRKRDPFKQALRNTLEWLRQGQRDEWRKGKKTE